ncbi:MAG: class I SAM-dependent methyltransferase [Candidatus Eisenbacteria bacterium]
MITPMQTRTLTRCLACGGGRLAALPMRYEHLGQAFPAARCLDCDLRFLRVQPEGESLARLYWAEYFSVDYRCGRSDTHSFDESAFRDENAGLLKRFEPYKPKAGPARLSEVGCASGWLLKHASERGWQARGVELSEHAVKHALGIGVEVVQGTLEDAKYADASADLLYMGDVLEHVSDCGATMREAVRVLAPGGAFFLRGPITTHSLARGLGLAMYGALGRDIVLHEPPYHLWEFTPGSLARLMHTVGLEVIRMDQSKIPPGRPHGRKSALQSLVMAGIDWVNMPITRVFNAFGDRVIMVARKPLG